MKKVIVISVFAVVIALIILAICIFPIKTEVTDTIRCYSLKNISLEHADDTDFGELSDKYIDVDLKLEITKGLFTKYVEGYAEIGEVQYQVSSVSFDYDGPGMAATFTRNSQRLTTSSIYISDDGTYFMLHISSNDDLEGVWLNCSDFGDYKKAMKYFYPHLELQ